MRVACVKFQALELAYCGGLLVLKDVLAKSQSEKVVFGH